MAGGIDTVLILGSGPDARAAAAWPRASFDVIVVINNAWRVRPDWDALIHPDDFPPARLPDRIEPSQRRVTSADYVPVQNRFGGFVYAGGTMAFTAGYWALGALRPKLMAYFGCDMVYPASGATHFYGTGTPDPLREDITLQSLEAKSARLEIVAARQGCRCVNLSAGPSRLVFERASPRDLRRLAQVPVAGVGPCEADSMEASLGYLSASGRYWEEQARFDAKALAELDTLWLQAHQEAGLGARTRADTRKTG